MRESHRYLIFLGAGIAIFVGLTLNVPDVFCRVVTSGASAADVARRCNQNGMVYRLVFVVACLVSLWYVPPEIPTTIVYDAEVHRQAHNASSRAQDTPGSVPVPGTPAASPLEPATIEMQVVVANQTDVEQAPSAAVAAVPAFPAAPSGGA
jgi:hypothetical protein